MQLQTAIERLELSYYLVCDWLWACKSNVSESAIDREQKRTIYTRCAVNIIDRRLRYSLQSCSLRR